MERVTAYLECIADLLHRLPREPVLRVAQALNQIHRSGGTLYVCGNGGSAATASHFALDLAKGARPRQGPPIRAIALTDSVPLLTAWANDTAYDRVFAEQLAAWYRPGDGLVAISGSGNSPNVLRAVEFVREHGGVSCGLAGYDGGKLAPMVTHPVIVPSDDLEKIEDCHMSLCHLYTAYLREELAQG